MSTVSDPHASYGVALADAQGQLASLRRWLRLVVWIRIASLVLFVGLAGQACSQHNPAWGGPVLTVLLFVALSVLTDQMKRLSMQEGDDVLGPDVV